MIKLNTILHIIKTFALIIGLMNQTVFSQKSTNESLDIPLVPWRIETFKRDTFPYTLLYGESADTIATKEIFVSDLGYRVQLGSTVNYYEALAIRDSAGTKFKEEIYLDYEQPNYKIRLGNFSDAESANASRHLARQSGFSDAWVIRTKIVVKKNK